MHARAISISPPEAFERPESSTAAATAFSGLLFFAFAIFAVRMYRPFGDDLVESTLFIMFMVALGILLPDIFWQKVHLRKSTGLNFFYKNPSWVRTGYKFLGLLASLSLIGTMYWAFPEYRSDFYRNYFEMLRIILPAWILAAPLYFYFVDRHMPEPRDGYWHLGHAVTFQWRKTDRRILGQHLLGWLIKGFYLPLMFSYALGNVGWFLGQDLKTLNNFPVWFDFLWNLLFFIDVSIVSTAYLMSLRLIDTHFRSAEPTALGWLVALSCYSPFNSMLGKQYFAYDTDFTWGKWLWDNPFLYGAWAGALLFLVIIFAWCSMSFGLRFSNLTNRGVITSGPYRWSKHPSYIVKNLSWWMISIPFVVNGSALESLRRCLLLLAFNCVYILRAKTEEWHLSRDPNYVRYALWVDEHGLFAPIKNWPVLKWLRYRAPGV